MKKYERQSEKMEQYGGSFAKALAVAYMRADHVNSGKIESLFADLFESYNKFLK